MKVLEKAVEMRIGTFKENARKKEKSPPTRMYFLEREAQDDIDPDLKARNEKLIKLNAKVKQQTKKKESLRGFIEAMAAKDVSEQNN